MYSSFPLQRIGIKEVNRIRKQKQKNSLLIICNNIQDQGLPNWLTLIYF